MGLGAAALYALLMATPWVEGYQANAELFMTLPLLAGLALLVRAGEHPPHDRRACWLVAGCGALAARVRGRGWAWARRRSTRC